MLKRELLKLTPEERDVIFLWRVIDYPKTQTPDEIVNCSVHKKDFVLITIKKFNRNCKAKLEAKCLEIQFKKDLIHEIESFFVDKREELLHLQKKSV